MASVSHPTQFHLDFLHDQPQISQDLFPGTIEKVGSRVKTGIRNIISIEKSEQVECEKCPDCDELALFLGKCNECGYCENPDYELPNSFYQTRRSKKITQKNSVIQKKINFQHKGMEVYRYEKNGLGQITQIYFRNIKETFCVKISGYIIRPQTISSRFGEESETIISILIPAGEISYQKANLKRPLGQIHKNHSQPVYDLVKHFLQDYHQKLQNT